MNRKKITILVIFLVAILTIIYTLTSTYAVIIEVKQEDGINEIVNKITLRDLATNDDGTFNKTYYDVKKELDITDGEASLLMESEKLNENLQIVLKSIVDYKLNNNINARLNNDDIYNLIKDGVNNTSILSSELRNKVINKSSAYKQDISDYLYDINISLVG